MRVFVHDATGYIGAAVVEVLAAAEHEVVGSVYAGREFEYGPASALAERADAADVDAANSLLLSAEAVVFPAEGAAEEARAALRLLKNGGYEGEKRFVLVSTLMTWAKSKQPEDGAGLQEEDYTKRKAAARYRDLKTLESQCKAVAKENLGTVVISAGILYGRGEDVLHGLFRQAWMCSPPALPVLAGAQGGANKLPMIHVSDLARVVAAACESLPEVPYVVAADSSQCTLREVVEAISSGLGTGKTRDLSREETQDLMLEDASASNLNVNLVFDVDSSTSHSIGIEWESQDGILANIDTVITQFKKVRDLRPVRAVIAGPPASGFKDVARSVSEKYYLEIVTRESAVAAATADPEPRTPPAGDAEEGEEVEEPEPTEAEAAAAALKEEVQEAQAAGKIPDALLCKVVRAKLRTPACRNKGWILLGFPSSWREVVGVFGAAEELEDGVGTEDDGEPAPEAGEEFKPSGVIVVQASDEDCRARALAAPEGEFDEASFAAALEAYRAANAEDNERSPASYFEAACRVETLESASMEDISLYLEKGQKPFNYHPTPEEREQKAKEDAAAQKERAEKEQAEKAAKETEEAAKREKAQAEEKKRLEEVKRQENELLEARSQPLRAYLMKHVIPTLTDGLIETCRVMPEDPVDYLAEYLFRASPVVEASSQVGGKTGK